MYCVYFIVINFFVIKLIKILGTFPNYDHANQQKTTRTNKPTTMNNGKDISQVMFI